MEVKVFELPPLANNAYLLFDRERGEAALFDAPWEVWKSAGPFLAEAECRLVSVFLTHGHWDHTAGAAELIRQGAMLCAHPGDRRLLENPSLMSSFMVPGVETGPVEAGRWLEDEQELPVLGQMMRVLHTPGHSPGGIVCCFPDQGFAFAGDTIFRGSVGRFDLPGGDEPALRKSILEKIYALLEETVLYPGHGPSTTVGRERDSNMVVRA